MKKDLLLAVAVTALSASTAFALTPPGGGVLGSVHDMNSVGSTVQKDTQGRVCAFCHTPHHAITAAEAGDYMPLWSHQMTELTDDTYTQYASLTYDADDLGPTVDPLAGPSRLCMSCHDGLIAPDQHYGSANDGTQFPGNEFTGTTWQIGIGMEGALHRTHPIGFNLADAAARDSGEFGSNATGKSGFVTDVATAAFYKGTAKTIKSQLYNGIMTCATCHDVHNKDNVTNGGYDTDHPDTLGRNYLVFAKQAGSQLCLSCHNK